MVQLRGYVLCVLLSRTSTKAEINKRKAKKQAFGSGDDFETETGTAVTEAGTTQLLLGGI